MHEKNKVTDGLAICFNTANTLKDLFPNELMAIKNDTIIPFSVENKRKIAKKSMGNTIAYFSNKTPHRIIVKQKYLKEQMTWRTKVNDQSDRVQLFGNFAMIELMCHELAHHKTKGHAKGFKLKYHKFLNVMVNKIISGEYYERYS